MVALDSVKHAALCKMVDYLFEDPETRFPKAMEMVDKAAPRNLFPSQREAFRNAIDEKNNWYQLLMKIAHLNPEVRNRLVKSFLIDSNLMVWGCKRRIATNTSATFRGRFCSIPRARATYIARVAGLRNTAISST